LKAVDPDQIVEFAEQYVDLQNEANTVGIFEAANIIGCSDSNDGYMDFRRWIVFQGETAFERIIKDPDFLGTYDRDADPVNQWYSEYDPRKLYRELTGQELPDYKVAVYPKGSTEHERPAVLATRYPQLWNRIHGGKRKRELLQEVGKKLFLHATLDQVECQSGYARFMFSTGAEIHIYDYWDYYRRIYKIFRETPSYHDHPMLGQTVTSIRIDNFPDSFFLWFENRRKLSLACEYRVCDNFRVFDRTNPIHS